MVVGVNLWYVVVATGDLQAYPAAGAYLASISYARLGVGYYFSVLAALALTHFMTQIRSGKKTMGATRGVIIMSVVALLMDLGQRLFVEVAGEAAMQCYAEHVNYFSFGMTVIYFIMICKAIKGLIDEFQATRMLWILPAVCVAAFMLKLFLVYQSFLVIATAVQEVMILMSIACGLWMLRKRVHFGLCDGGRGNAPL